MYVMADTQLILHVKGTEQTTSLPKPAVRAGIKEGQIKYSQLIWSPIHNAWKQVREMPHLWPSQKIAPAPPIRPPSRSAEGVPVVTASPTPLVSAPRGAGSTTLSGMVPRVAVTPRAAGAARVPETRGGRGLSPPKAFPCPKSDLFVAPVYRVDVLPALD